MKQHDLVLQRIQPLALGSIDGAVSSLAPLFASALATHSSFATFLIGMSVATGAGISMALSEALSDDGKLSGRGSPLSRGLITGGATFTGGTLHTLPFLIGSVHLALTVAFAVVGVELLVIALIRHRYFGTPVWLSLVQVFAGGRAVVAAGVLFGSA